MLDILVQYNSQCSSYSIKVQSVLCAYAALAGLVYSAVFDMTTFGL